MTSLLFKSVDSRITVKDWHAPLIGSHMCRGGHDPFTAPRSTRPRARQSINGSLSLSVYSTCSHLRTGPFAVHFSR